MRRTTGIALLLLAACTSPKQEEKPTEKRAAASAGSRIEIDRSVYDDVRSLDLGREGGAKTIDWRKGSTPEAATYLAGAVLVDKIFREDADGFYGVRVRLGNRTAQEIRVEYRIVLYDGEGRELAGLRDGFHTAVLDPRGTVTVRNSCRVRGAEGFRLSVRRPGASDDGRPDAVKPVGKN